MRIFLLPSPAPGPGERTNGTSTKTPEFPKTMEQVAQIGEAVTSGLAYIGSVASLASRTTYFTFIGPFRGKPLRLGRVITQAREVGVRALPILSLIAFFIGLLLALQSAYELRKFGALNYVASAVAVSMSRGLGPLITAILVIGRSDSAFAAEIETMKENPISTHHFRRRISAEA